MSAIASAIRSFRGLTATRVDRWNEAISRMALSSVRSCSIGCRGDHLPCSSTLTIFLLLSVAAAASLCLGNLAAKTFKFSLCPDCSGADHHLGTTVVASFRMLSIAPFRWSINIGPLLNTTRIHFISLHFTCWNFSSHHSRSFGRCLLCRHHVAAPSFIHPSFSSI